MTKDLKNNILAVDTSSPELKLGLSFGEDRIIQSCERVDKSHSRLIIKKIGELFQSAGLHKNELEAIVICTGPGSFTGMRIGLAAAKGMAVALDIPIVGVNLFEVAANILSYVNQKVYVIIGLNRDQCFVAPVEGGSYDKDAISIISYNNLLQTIGRNSVAGLGIDLSKHFPKLNNVNLSQRLEYDASALLHLGAQKLALGLSNDIVQLEPLYLQKSQAEIRFEQRQREQ